MTTQQSELDEIQVLEQRIVTLKAIKEAEAAEAKRIADEQLAAKELEERQKKEADARQHTLDSMTQHAIRIAAAVTKLLPSYTSLPQEEVVVKPVVHSPWNTFYEVLVGTQFSYRIERSEVVRQDGRYRVYNTGKYSLRVHDIDYSRHTFPIRKDGSYNYEEVARWVLNCFVEKVTREVKDMRAAVVAKQVEELVAVKKGLTSDSNLLGACTSNVVDNQHSTIPIRLNLSFTGTQEEIADILKKLAYVGHSVSK